MGSSAWIAVRGVDTLDGVLLPILLGSAVLFWVAGFDILYACMDVDFDRTVPLHSIPKRLGVAGALRLAAVLHVVTIAFLGSVALVRTPGPAWVAGLVVVAGLLIYEHRLVRPDDLSRMDRAFFTINSFVGVVLLVCVVLDQMVFGRLP